MSGKGIPTDDEFARASAAIKKRSRGLSDVREKILARFKDATDLYEFFILDSSEKTFIAYIFYRLDQQVAEAEKSGLAGKIQDAVFYELERAGRGARGAVRVDFEFDSDESVRRTYDGNYYNRLH